MAVKDDSKPVMPVEESLPPASRAKRPPASAGQSRYAVTFGEVSVLHTGGRELGSGIREHGFSVEQLSEAADKIRAAGGQAQLVHISEALPQNLQTPEHKAAVLVIRNGAGLICGDPVAAAELMQEQTEKVRYDTMYWDARRKRRLNKRARYNVVFGDAEVAPSDDFSVFTVRDFAALPHLRKFREGLPTWLGEGSRNLTAEGNHYFEAGSGIGFHGDSERKIVICLSLGQPSILRYHWRLPGSSEHEFEPVDIKIGHGDVYVMSEKATGFDWRLRSRVRVVHAAGSSKYTGA